MNGLLLLLLVITYAATQPCKNLPNRIKQIKEDLKTRRDNCPGDCYDYVCRDRKNGEKKTYVQAHLRAEDIATGSVVSEKARKQLKTSFKECSCEHSGHIVPREFGGAVDMEIGFQYDGESLRPASFMYSLTMHTENVVEAEYFGQFQNEDHSYAEVRLCQVIGSQKKQHFFDVIVEDERHEALKTCSVSDQYKKLFQKPDCPTTKNLLGDDSPLEVDPRCMDADQAVSIGLAVSRAGIANILGAFVASLAGNHSLKAQLFFYAYIKFALPALLGWLSTAVLFLCAFYAMQE
uniref:Uncharacterized protein n=1 Tax=Ditylenchus dipsaci TaxID=166011 RepID=A0A915EH40_9BILA